MIDLRDTPESYNWMRAIVFGGILALSGAVISISNYFERHYQKDPFVISKLIVGVGCDAIRSVFVGFAVYGSGGNSFIAWSVAMFVVFIGAEKTTVNTITLRFNRIILTDEFSVSISI